MTTMCLFVVTVVIQKVATIIFVNTAEILDSKMNENY